MFHPDIPSPRTDMLAFTRNVTLLMHALMSPVLWSTRCHARGFLGCACTSPHTLMPPVFPVLV